MATNNRSDELLNRLTTGITQLTNSDRWRDWLTVQSRFHKYSFGNTLLILMQRPDASRIAGFRTWLQLERRVQAGEKAIWILAPMTRPRLADALGQEPEILVTGFRPVPVFDISQTEGADLPVVCARLEGEDAKGTYSRLVAVAAGFGFSVEDFEFTDSTNGDCNTEQRRIRVRTSNSPAQRIKTLAHEMGHAQLHENSALDRPLKELEAESVAFVVCCVLGLSTDTYSFGYVAAWSGGGEEATAGIKASGARIQHAANAILGALEKIT